MLDTIKAEIQKEVPDFSEFYRDYVMSVQDDVIEKDLQSCRNRVTGINSILAAEKEICQLAEGLKEL